MREQQLDDYDEPDGQDDSEECTSCVHGVTLGILKQLCESEGAGSACQKRYSEVIAGKRSVKSFVKFVGSKMNDPENEETFKSVRAILKEKGVI